MEPAPTVTSSLARGAASGLAGTVVMTAFQRFVEMPLTRRDESYAPADLMMRLLPIRPGTKRGRRRLNYAAHFGLGVGWGVARAVVARSGLRGQAAVGATFAAMYPGDVALATALGVYRPRGWSLQDVVVDVVDKLVQAESTGLVYDALERRAGSA